MIVLIDNYDSFVFNVARYLEELGHVTRVLRNDAVGIAALRAMEPEAIVLSPGPCTPNEAGISLTVVKELAEEVPILGICLGHQCIGQVFGGRVVRARQPMHGRASAIVHDGQDLFETLPSPLSVGRYHSLIVELPDDYAGPLAVTARAADGEIMAVAHRDLPTLGVQFHPESILTEHGHRLLANFMRLARKWHSHVLV